MINLPKFSSPKNITYVSHSNRECALQVYKDDLPRKSGWLQKRTSGSLKRWQWRFFTLENRVLSYFKSEVTENSLCSISFDKFRASLSILPEHSIRINFESSKKRLKLKGPEMRDWTVCLLQHIETSEGSLAPPVKDFWKYPVISNEEFVRKSMTGDLLLFTTKSTLAKIQRGFTRSKYDHVGILLKLVSGHLGLFETTSQDGVSVVMWNDFLRMNWHKLYSKLVYRPLVIPDREIYVNKLQEFVQNNMGKKYKISIKKLLFKKRQNSDTEQSYFCSELVAKAFQDVGLLNRKKAPWRFMPGHFSDEKKLRFEHGRLGQSELIYFNA